RAAGGGRPVLTNQRGVTGSGSPVPSDGTIAHTSIRQETAEYVRTHCRARRLSVPMPPRRGGLRQARSWRSARSECEPRTPAARSPECATRSNLWLAGNYDVVAVAEHKKL